MRRTKSKIQGVLETEYGQGPMKRTYEELMQEYPVEDNPAEPPPTLEAQMAAERMELAWKQKLHTAFFSGKEVDVNALQVALTLNSIHYRIPSFDSVPVLERLVINVMVCDPRSGLEKDAVADHLIQTYKAMHARFVVFNYKRSATWLQTRRKHFDSVWATIRICIIFKLPLRYTTVGTKGHPDTFTDTENKHALVSKIERFVEEGKNFYSARIDQCIVSARAAAAPALLVESESKGELEEIVPLSGSMRVFPLQFILAKWRFFVPKRHMRRLSDLQQRYDMLQVYNFLARRGVMKDQKWLPKPVMVIILYHLSRTRIEWATTPTLEDLARSGGTYYERQDCSKIWKTTEF